MSKSDNNDSAAPALVGGVAGVLPFAGAVGDRNVMSPAQGPQVKSLKQLASKAKPGDVLMAGAPGTTVRGAFNKAFINLGIGRPAAYHPTIVEGISPDGRLTILEHGPKGGWQRKTLSANSASSLSLLRPKDGTRALGTVQTAQRYVAANESLGKALAARGLSPEQVTAVQKKAYSHRLNPAIGFRELFLPKVSETGLKVRAQRKGADQALLHFEQNIDNIADELAGKVKAGKGISVSDLKCLGGVCTTTAAKAGVPVRGGTTLSHASPRDILASGQLTNIGHKPAEGSTRLSRRIFHKALQHGPTAVRAGAGIGLGTLAYKGAKKLWGNDASKTAAVAAAAPAAAGASYGGELTAAGVGAGLIAPRATQPLFSKEVTRYTPGKPINIYYTDPARGRGHFQQAQNIAKALEARGVPYNLVNVEEKFTSPEARKKLIETYDKVRRGEISQGEWKRAWTQFYAKEVDKGALKAHAKAGGGTILTNPGLAPWMRGAGPANVVISDPSKAMMETPLGTSWSRAQDIKYVPKGVEGYTGQHVRRVANVPVDPGMFQRGTTPVFGAGTANVTVSGGGTGTDVVKQVQQLLQSKTQTIGGKPITIHALSANMAKRDPKQFAALQDLARQNPGRIKVHGLLEPEQIRNVFQQADMNVLRPHGTMGTEAMLAKKPMILTARGGVGPGGNLAWAPGMNLSNARRFQQLTDAPMAGLGGQTTQANLGQVFDESLGKTDELAKGVQRGASGVKDTATGIVDDIIKNPRVKARGRIPFSKPVAMAGGGLIAAAGAKALWDRHRAKTAEVYELDADMTVEGYQRGLNKASAVMSLISEE